MKLKEMIPGIMYKVTKGGSTLFEDDRVYVEQDYNSDNYNLYSKEAGGWLTYDDWKSLKNEVEIDKEYYRELIKNYEHKIETYKKFLVE